SSVLGTVSTIPVFVASYVTASKILSEIGSIVYRISSLTETTAFISVRPIGFAAGGAAGFGDEQFAVNAATYTTPAATMRRLSPLNMEVPYTSAEAPHTAPDFPLLRSHGDGEQKPAWVVR